MTDAFKLFAFVSMLVGCFIFHTWLRTQVLTTGYEISNIQREIKDLDSHKHELKIQRSRLFSPEYLESLVKGYHARGETFTSPVSTQVHYLRFQDRDVHEGN